MANLNASVEHPSRPAGAAPVYVRVSGWFALRSIMRRLPSPQFRSNAFTCRFLRTSENSRYAKFALFRAGIYYIRGLALLSGRLWFVVLWLSSDLANAGCILPFPGSDDPRSLARPRILWWSCASCGRTFQYHWPSGPAVPGPETFWLQLYYR
jgi:hypothetical protein